MAPSPSLTRSALQAMREPNDLAAAVEARTAPHRVNGTATYLVFSHYHNRKLHRLDPDPHYNEQVHSTSIFYTPTRPEFSRPVFESLPECHGLYAGLSEPVNFRRFLSSFSLAKAETADPQ
jgi:hypothetical protein